METTISVKVSKAETDAIFTDYAKRKTQEMLLHPEQFNCQIMVDAEGNCTVLKGIEIILRSKSE